MTGLGTISRGHGVRQVTYKGVPLYRFAGDHKAGQTTGKINVVMKLGYLDPQEVIAVLKERDPNLHVVLTGRGAPPEICDFADTVSEIKAVKHHYKAGVKAQQGIEF